MFCNSASSGIAWISCVIYSKEKNLLTLFSDRLNKWFHRLVISHFHLIERGIQPASAWRAKIGANVWPPEKLQAAPFYIVCYFTFFKAQYNKKLWKYPQSFHILTPLTTDQWSPCWICLTFISNFISHKFLKSKYSYSGVYSISQLYCYCLYLSHIISFICGNKKKCTMQHKLQRALTCFSSGFFIWLWPWNMMNPVPTTWNANSSACRR